MLFVARVIYFFLIELLQDDQEPKDPKFSPDGGYIPRILFMGKSVGGVLQIKRDKNDNFPYFLIKTCVVTSH